MIKYFIGVYFKFWKGVYIRSLVKYFSTREEQFPQAAI